MNDIEKQKYFTLTDAVNSSISTERRDIRDVKPLRDNEAPKYKTLTDAVRGFKFNQEVIDDIQSNLTKMPEATFGEKVKAGGENWLLSLRQTPESVRNLIYRHFQGIEYPNATTRQALAIAEASAIRMDNEKQMLQLKQTEEGTADSVIANLTSGALSVGEFALMGLATGGLGYTLMGAQEAGDLSQEFVSKDIESGKIYEAGYKGQSLKEVIAADTYGAVAGWIEKGLGIEQSISEAWLSLAKQGAKSATKKSIGEAIVKGSIGEGLEEFLQGEASWATGKIIGKEDKDFYEGFQDSLISGVYGAILGGAFGGASTGLENGVARYYQARQDMASILMNKGIEQKEAVQIADNTLTSAVDFITTELEGRNSLQTYFGEDWNKLVDGVAQAYISQGWKQRFPDKDVREFAEMNAKAMVAPVIELSNRTNMPLKQILDLANFRQNENALFIDMPNVDDPKALTKEVNRRKEEVKRLKSMPATKATDTVKRLNEQIKILNLRLKNLESYNAIEKARMDSRKANLDNDLLASTRPEIMANLGGIRQAQRGESFVYVGNNQVPVRYVVKPMAEVQASHIAGEANPKYTLKELPNRTRGTVTDDAILQNRAANLKPEELAESPNTQYGAPVVNKNGEVISGNGRMETLRRAYELGNTSYKEMLDNLGYNTEGIERPVLVRETIDDLTSEQQVAIAEASNVSETSAFDHARQAMNDAKLLKKGISDPVTFADELPVSERQAYIRENGQYDLLALQRRFDDAVLAWIIGDTKTFDSLVLANRLNQKVIKGISMQGGNIVEFSKSNPTLGIKKDLRYALVKSASIKTRGHFIPAVQQQDIEEGVTFNADALLYAMTFSNNSSELSNFIGQYVQTHQSYIDGQKDSFLADSLPKLSKEDVTNQVLLNNPLTSSKFDKDGTCTDSNLKAVILNRIPVENVGYGTIKIEPEATTESTKEKTLDDIVSSYQGSENFDIEAMPTEEKQTVVEAEQAVNDSFKTEKIEEDKQYEEQISEEKEETKTPEEVSQETTEAIKENTLPEVEEEDLFKTPKEEKTKKNKNQKKIEDFGEKIEGARKDIWQSYRDKLNKDLPTDPSKIKLSEVFPEPNYEKAIADGVDVNALATIKALRDIITAKPKYGVKSWVDTLVNLRDMAARIVNNNFDMSFIDELLSKPEVALLKNQIDLYRMLGYPYFTKAKGYMIKTMYYHKYYRDEYAWTSTYHEGEPISFRLMYKFRDIRVNGDYQFENVIDGVEEIKKRIDEEEGKGKEKKVKFDIYYHTNKKDEIIVGKKVGSGKYVDLKKFNSVKEAQEYIVNNYDELVKELEDIKKNPIDRGEVNQARIGENYRKGADVSPETFADTFGFRGVQFGNWVEQQTRIKDLNEAYDALVDLSKVLNIPTRAISLNGTLGLAFGARGHKGASAHYEPDKIVINLTKMTGAGSLAHEWFHALDNSFMKKDEKGLDYTSERALSENPLSHNRPEVMLAFFNLRNVLEKSGLYERSKKWDSWRSKDYFSTIREMGARTFEQYVKDKLAEKGVVNDFLANIIETGDDYDTYLHQDEKSEIYDAYDKLFNTLKTRETDKGVELYQGKSINGYFDAELKTIVLGSNFNFGTLQHEFAHFFLKRVFDIYKTGAGTQEFNDWFSQLSSILDIKADQFALTTPQQEQFARMTESYLFNKAEFPEGAKPAMQMFFDWCPAEYNELLSIGWKDDKGIYHNSVFNKESLDFFNDMYSLVPELGDSPLVRTFTNETNRNGTIIPADAEQRKEREKLIGETQVETVTPETTQASINIQNTPDPEVEEAYKEAIETEQERKKTPVEKFTQYVRIGRGTNTREEMDELAQDYIKKHRENAERVAFGNPIPSGYEDETGLSLGYVENNTGIDRAVLILNLMNEYTPNSPEYNQLYHNFAIYRSYASKSAGLTNDVNTNYYLKGYVEINKALTQKAALVKYGKTDNAVNLWNRDIDKFISQNIDKVYNTEPESAERDKAIAQFIDDAKAMFGSDESVLLQEEIRIKKAKDKQAFIDWANRVVKQIAKGKMPPMDEAKLMDLSVKAQKASKFIDSNNVDEAVAASQDIRAWQDFVNQKGLPESFVDKIIGTYLPSAMLSSPSTHALNAVSNFFNNVAIRAATRLHYGSNVINGDVLEKEYNRLKAIYAESGHNLSEDNKPDDVSRLHGEHWQFKKPESVLGYLSPMRLLGWSDFYFRAHTYVDTLARIASQDAKGDPKKALELFNEYKQMNSVNQRAKEARLQAIMTGHIAVFTNNGTLANISAGMRHYLDYINLVEIGKGGHKGLGTLIMPFAKVPANIVGMGIQAVSSPFKLLGKWTGLKKDWTIQDSIALTNFGLFSSIVGIYLMAGLDYEPPYEPPHKYDPNKPYDSIKIGGVWVSVESFGALANPLRFTFTMLDMISNGKKVEPSLVKAIEGLKNDVPFTSVEFDNDYMKRKPADWLVSATYNQLSKAVPAAVKKPIAWTNRALGLQIEQDSALKRKIARQYGLDGKQTTINDYLSYIYRGIKVDTK